MNHIAQEGKEHGQQQQSACDERNLMLSGEGLEDYETADKVCGNDIDVIETVEETIIFLEKRDSVFFGDPEIFVIERRDLNSGSTCKNTH